MAVAVSLNIVSADNSVNIGGIDFNIPDGYIENEAVAMDHESGKYPTNDGKLPCNISFKGFDKGNDNIGIYVTEFDSPDDAKKVMDYDKKVNNRSSKTVNGNNGTLQKNNKNCQFAYCKDNYYIYIGTTDESLLESIVPK